MNLTEKEAELAGIILGDGYISLRENNPKNNNSLKISLNSETDKDYLFYIKNLLQDMFKIKPKIKYRKNENTVDLFIFNKKIIKFLINNIGLKLSPKWNRAIIPKKFTLNNLDLYVLKGYFDTDGCLVTANNNRTCYPRLEMKISPSPMQNQFIKILKKYSFRFGAYKIGKGKIRIQLNGKEQLEKWNSLVGFSNKKHSDKVKRFL